MNKLPLYALVLIAIAAVLFKLSHSGASKHKALDLTDPDAAPPIAEIHKTGEPTATLPASITEVRFDPQSQQNVRDFLDKKDELNPDVEFASLHQPDFDNVETAMLAGGFEDEEKHVQMRLSGEEATNLLSRESCITTPATGLAQADNEGLILHVNSHGYGAIMIKNRWYIRLAYFLQPKRTLMGKIYEHKGDAWSFVSDFTANESSGYQCPKLKNAVDYLK